MVLEAEGGIAKWRDTMGATDPKKAAPGTIRHDLGTSIGAIARMARTLRKRQRSRSAIFSLGWN